MNHERRNLEDKARSSRRHRDRDAHLDAGTDRWLEKAARDQAAADLAAVYGTALEDAVEKLRRTMGR